MVLLISSLILSMNSATADGGRALYGIARDDMTIKGLFTSTGSTSRRARWPSTWW